MFDMFKRMMLLIIVGVCTVQAAPPEEPDKAAAADLRILRDAGVATDGAWLLDFLGKQTVSDEQRRNIAKLVEQLGDDDFLAREQATGKLKAYGTSAVPALRLALKQRDAEVVARAKLCLEAITKMPSGDVQEAAVRVLVHRDPPKALEVLLAFLPDAADPGVEDAVIHALAIVGVRDGKAVPLLVDALTHKLPAVRAAAAEALIRSCAPGQTAAVRKLLNDPQLVVKVRVALALVYAKDKEAVPVLIDLLPQLTCNQAWQVEEMLARLAGSQAPKLGSGDRTEALKKYRDDWQAWWKEKGDKVDLAVLADVKEWKAKVSAPRGTGAWDGHTPDKAFVGQGWNSGGFAPQWIEADLGAAVRFSTIVLTVGQSPDGPTVHEVWVSDEPIGDDRSNAKLVHTFRGFSKNGDRLRFEFSNRAWGRYIQIHTTNSPSWVSWSEIVLRVK